MVLVCSKPGCAAVPVIKQKVRSSVGRGTARTYLLCNRHDDDYFAGRDWLDAKRAERIQQELIPAEL